MKKHFSAKAETVLPLLVFLDHIGGRPEEGMFGTSQLTEF